MNATTKPFIAVVGFDFSDSAELALDQCLELVSRHAQSEVHVVYVVPALALAASPLLPSVPTEVSADMLDEAATRLRKAVDERIARFTKQGAFSCRVISHLRVHETAAAIAQLASDLEADLLVVGTHSRRGVARLLLGSVAQSVVTIAPCPVLVVRPKRVEAPAPVIEPPCPRCVSTRRTSNGAEFWCEQHRQHHGRRHTYHQDDRVSTESNFPLVVR